MQPRPGALGLRSAARSLGQAPARARLRGRARRAALPSLQSLPTTPCAPSPSPTRTSPSPRSPDDLAKLGFRGTPRGIRIRTGRVKGLGTHCPGRPDRRGASEEDPGSPRGAFHLLNTLMPSSPTLHRSSSGEAAQQGTGVEMPQGILPPGAGLSVLTWAGQGELWGAGGPNSAIVRGFVGCRHWSLDGARISVPRGR